MASRSKKRRLESDSPKAITAYFPLLRQSCSTGAKTQTSELSENPIDDHDSNSELEFELVECENETGNFENEPVEFENVPVERENEPDELENEPLSLPTKPACKSFCCASSEIYQPTDIHVLEKTERIYCLKVYSHQCKLAAKLNVRNPKADPAFSTEGFCNWKKAVVRFREHQMSYAHQVAVAAHISRQKPINQQLEKQITKAQQKRRHSFLKQLSALCYLLRQGLAIRNDHGSGSNLTVLLRMVLDEDTWVQDKRYQSSEIINELINIMAHTVLRSILPNIFSQRWFALLADETRDVANREQLVLCIRWVSDSYEINEDVVGLIQLSDTTAATIHKSLKNSLISLGFQFENCRGQAFDGASNFQGHVSGEGKSSRMKTLLLFPCTV